MTNGDDETEEEKVQSSTRLRALSVYEVVRREGEEELTRPTSSLWWSGVAAGMAISTSVLAEGVLLAELPEMPGRDLIAGFGYCAGFLIVVLGRMQLFTENTITPVLPLMANFSRTMLAATARLWGVVLAANLVGTLGAAVSADILGLVTDRHLIAFRELAHDSIMERSSFDILTLAVPAGFYVATLVWMLPSSKGFEFWVIMLMTYLIAIGDFSHVIVGSVEAFLLLIDGQIGAGQAVFGFFLPALLGNILGGTALFSLLAYAQVREEID